MIIIAGYTLTETDERDAAVAAFAEMVARVRKADGCLDVSISADSVDPERVNVVELWRDQQSLDAWRNVARAPDVEDRETYVKLHRTEKAEEPF
ncbi:MAG: antibiotic biosynthesis monooxygenase [Chloroflexi bacterium]|nr:antibiotic biosynthesis monooxygenase [Chloroflexota bacterium]